MKATQSTGDKIASLIPTEYAGNLVSMSVKADYNGQPVRVWYHPHYAGQRGYWMDGLNEEAIEPKDGDVLTVRSCGHSTNESWDWAKRYVFINGDFVFQPLAEVPS